MLLPYDPHKSRPCDANRRRMGGDPSPDRIAELAERIRKGWPAGDEHARLNVNHQPQAK